jgi:penicillin-binding protein 1A
MADRRQTSEDRKRERQTSKAANTTKKGKPKKKKSWFKRIIFTILLLGLAGFLAGVSVFAYYASSAPELDEELLKYPVSSEIYDVNGNLITKLGEENREFVAYEDIPQEMIDAILATEDVRFFDHFGIDVLRLGSAVIANVRDGFGAQGASTITQQVVKNSFLKNEKKLKRKAQEAWLAIKLEREYSKEEIFEMYFNRVLMSGTVYGFGTAAKYFYGKELNELTLGEMAQLAGMPQSPNNFNPYKYPDSAEKRRNIVLRLMVQHGKITQAEADAVMQTSVASSVLAEDQRQQNNGMKYPAFVSVVIDELRENGDYELLSEGIKIYTTLDPKAQMSVEAILNNSANFPTEDIEAGVAVVDTKTGAIVAVGGGRNYGTDLLFNRSIDVDQRSPGSTAKPLVAYGPAIENLKWSTGHLTTDEKMTYPNSNQVITNWDGKYNGNMTIREALYSSRNIPAVKTLIEVGTDKSKAFLNKLNIYPEHVYYSSTLGPEIHVSPVDMAAAYAAFGNNGVFTKGHSITKIVYRDGVSSKSYTPDSHVAMEDYTAYMVTDILRDTLSNKPGASGNYAAISGVDIAGKTGTSNYSSEDFSKFNLPKSAVPDSWFAGYTSDYSIAIWTGYDDYGTPITTWPERRLGQTLFKSIMTDLVNNFGKPSTFKKPSSVVEATIEVGTNQLASEYTPSDLRRTELFVRGTQPTSVSNSYEKPEVGGITALNAAVNPESTAITLNWGYNGTSEDGSAPTFDVSVSVNGGASTVLTSSTGMSYTLSNIVIGNSYTFTVTPKIGEEAGTPASTTILVAAPSTPPPGEDDDNDDDNNEDDNEENNPNESSPPVTTPPNSNGQNGSNTNGNNGGSTGNNTNGTNSGANGSGNQ